MNEEEPPTFSTPDEITFEDVGRDEVLVLAVLFTVTVALLFGHCFYASTVKPCATTKPPFRAEADPSSSWPHGGAERRRRGR